MIKRAIRKLERTVEWHQGIVEEIQGEIAELMEEMELHKKSIDHIQSTGKRLLCATSPVEVISIMECHQKQARNKRSQGITA